MGRIIEQVLAKRSIECVGISEDIASFDPVTASGAICIDFTSPAAFRANYPLLAQRFKGVVVGTTGWDDIREDVFGAFRSSGTPLVYASNFSIGVNALFAVTEKLSRILGGTSGYHPYVLEMHHCHKLDAPSGTAKTLGELVHKGIAEDFQIQSVRCGEIPGIHEVGFEGECDRITIRHEAFSREGFAQGAVQAAVWCDALEGIHEFKDLLSL